MTDSKGIHLERLERLGEEQLQKRLQQEQGFLSECSPSEQLYLLHELRVYQIELEMQNRELHEMRAELEAARDCFANLYDASPVGYMTVDENGVIRQINLTAARLLQAEPAHVREHPFSVFLLQGEAGRFFNYLKRVFEAADDTVVEEFRLQPKQGDLLEVSLKSILSQDPQSGRWVCRTALIDLTQQRRAEAEAQASRDALAHATRVNKLGELASGVVHELSQPLSAITTYSGILEGLINEHGSEQDMARLANKITDQAERSITLLQQLRDFARSRPLKKSYQDLAALVDNALGLIGNKLRNSGIRVVLCADRSLPPVFVDPIQITQVLINLLSNAVDAQRKRNIRGKVVIAIHACDAHSLVTRVQDNGPGIAPEIADQLFLPFRTTKQSGLGIGLSLSRSIIEAHHGKIWADQDVTQGVAFSFTLPTVEGEMDE